MNCRREQQQVEDGEGEHEEADEGADGAGAVRTLVRFLMFPFTVLYLLLFAAAVHLRRKLHSRKLEERLTHESHPG